MFTGIVENLGTIELVEEKNECRKFIIKPHKIFPDFVLGESIAVNGVCLTLIEHNLNFFSVAAVPETLRLTNLQYLKVGDIVNLERAMLANTRIGGHLVQGHVDTIAEIKEIIPEGDACLVIFSLSPDLNVYLIKKGFISIDGMSITIIQAIPGQFTVTFIPFSQEHTIFKNYEVGTKVNIEVDMMAKYIKKNLELYYESKNTNE